MTAASNEGQHYDVRFGWRRRLPVIHQSETSECALACLAMIASYYGREIDLLALRRCGWTSTHGLSMNQLVQRADALGLQSRPLRLELADLAKLRTPCVMHVDLNHFVVLKRVSRRHVLIHDPATGFRKMSLRDLSDRFTGVALELFPSPTFIRRKEKTPLSLKALAGRLQGLKRAFLLILAFALALELFSLAAPFYVQTVIDQVTTNRDVDLLTLLSLSFLALIVLQALIGGLRTWAVTSLGLNVNLAWTGNVFAHLMKLPDDYFRKRHLGDVVSRFGSIQVIQQTLTARALETVLDGVMACLTLMMLFFYSSFLAWLALGAIALYSCSRALSHSMLREANLDQITAMARQESHFLESMRATTLIRLHNLAATHVARYMNKATETVNKGAGIQSIDLVFAAVNTVLLGSVRVITVWVGARMVLSGEFTAGMLMAFLAYNEQFTGRASRLIDFVVQLKLLRLQTERLADIVLSEPERHLRSELPVPAVEGSIACDAVSYRYGEGGEWVLRGCSMRIEAGESVAIVGPSGCGKSTLVRLLAGLADPSAGRVLVGGLDLRELGKERHREFTGVVMQDDQLLTGSIADNISLFDPNHDHDRIEECARLAGVHDDIIRMAMRYQTLVGDMGSSLSGGQRQRICLARALYRRPKILLLDEATSHLDVTREAEISSNIAALRLTRIIIAHRPETIRTADRVLLLADGCIEELQPLRASSSPTIPAPQISVGAIP